MAGKKGAKKVTEKKENFFISEDDRYLFGNGTHYDIYKKLGAHIAEVGGKKGVFFAVWAPHAAAVHVIGSFNDWNEDQYLMERLPDSGIYTLFIKDVKEGDYFYDAVLWAVRNGITTGTSTDTFSPDLNCTRAQVMTFLWRAKNSPDVGRRVMSFTDVKADQYYYDPVCWAVKEGITAGTSDTTFDPDASCTRAQVVTFLWQAYK